MPIHLKEKQPDGSWKEVDMKDMVYLLKFFAELAANFEEKAGVYPDLPEKEDVFKRLQAQYPDTWRDVAGKYPRWFQKYLDANPDTRNHNEKCPQYIHKIYNTYTGAVHKGGCRLGKEFYTPCDIQKCPLK